jgi:F-type H+-transporting ATPase subunit epsilon
MATPVYTLGVVTPERKVYEGTIVSLRAPGGSGYLGVLANHAPLVTTLVPGKLTVREEGGAERVFAVSGGFLEVADNVAVLLADSAESPDEIDRARAEAARERAKDRLSKGDRDLDRVRAEAALARAMNRLRIAGVR